MRQTAMGVLMGGALALAACGAAMAASQTCFSAFGGSVQYQFQANPGVFKVPGTRSIPGVVFGALSPCAGLNFWGVVGTVVSDGKTTVLGLRDETADAAGCGAVDVTVSLSPQTLSGPLQLYNDRTNFGNSDTLTQTGCQPVPAVRAPHTGRDVFGN